MTKLEELSTEKIYRQYQISKEVFNRLQEKYPRYRFNIPVGTSVDSIENRWLKDNTFMVISTERIFGNIRDDETAWDLNQCYVNDGYTIYAVSEDKEHPIILVDEYGSYMLGRFEMLPSGAYSATVKICGGCMKLFHMAASDSEDFSWSMDVEEFYHDYFSEMGTTDSSIKWDNGHGTAIFQWMGVIDDGRLETHLEMFQQTLHTVADFCMLHNPLEPVEETAEEQKEEG